jgi:hypothetical protein
MNTQGDTKFIVGTVLAIIAVGLLIAGALLLTLRAGTTQPKCAGPIVVGIANSIRESVKESPVHNQFTSRCDYWAAVHNGKLLAIKTSVPGRNCAVRWVDRLHSFVCGDATIGWSQLEYWPAREVNRPQQPGAWEIDFGAG